MEHVTLRDDCGERVLTWRRLIDGSVVRAYGRAGQHQQPSHDGNSGGGGGGGSEGTTDRDDEVWVAVDEQMAAQLEGRGSGGRDVRCYMLHVPCCASPGLAHLDGALSIRLLSKATPCGIEKNVNRHSFMYGNECVLLTCSWIVKSSMSAKKTRVVCQRHPHRGSRRKVSMRGDCEQQPHTLLLREPRHCGPCCSMLYSCQTLWNCTVLTRSPKRWCS